MGNKSNRQPVSNLDKLARKSLVQSRIRLREKKESESEMFYDDDYDIYLNEEQDEVPVDVLK